jgi:hypothetical protein
MIEALFSHEGFKCVVLFTRRGHRCGYVGVAPSHPFYDKHYNEVPYMDVHGGLTYSAYASENPTYPTDQIEKMKWFGFDCAHLGDAIDLKATDQQLSRKQHANIQWYTGWAGRETDSQVRSKTYVVQECKSLAEKFRAAAIEFKELKDSGE